MNSKDIYFNQILNFSSENLRTYEIIIFKFKITDKASDQKI